MIEPGQSRTLILACALLLALPLSGCGEFAYKRGASAGDLEAAKKTCREKGSGAAYEQCLADSGWTVQNLGRMEPLDADPVIEASVIPSNIRIENATSAAPDKHDAEDKGSGPAPTRKPDLLDTFKVSSWWKAGSGASSLEVDTNACVAQLGEAHRPVQTQQTQTATRGLLLCMKAKGWSALRAK
ncbi:MAG: hypothetical protein HY018_02140 [Hydrogenophilales bacterium]|nr:hypothetical protein [Hydrogenophilales bacterium]